MKTAPAAKRAKYSPIWALGWRRSEIALQMDALVLERAPNAFDEDMAGAPHPSLRNPDANVGAGELSGAAAGHPLEPQRRSA
jgi:hypothetical protein